VSFYALVPPFVTVSERRPESILRVGGLYYLPVLWSGMGFGSYDESEQQEQTVDEDDGGESVNVHEHDHQGEVSIEDADSEELLNQLQDIKDDGQDEEAEE
jgi:nucleosome binding factor SPN SPT16 subunit